MAMPKPYTEYLKADSLAWLLEPDAENPGVRFSVLRDLLGRKMDDPEMRRAQAQVMESGAVPHILEAQYPEGYWMKPGGGYSPKYRSTVWQIMWLAELGADGADSRVRRGCEYLMAHGLTADGAYSCNQKPTASGVIHCLNGNLTAALMRLGYAYDHLKIAGVLDWIARAATGKGEINYLRSATTAPNFRCSANGGMPCAWGAVKDLKGLALVPPAARTPLMQEAIDMGVELLLSRELVVADYPTSSTISQGWFKLGFPLSYWSDILEVLAVLADLGLGADPRLAQAWQFVLDKQNEDGRWTLEHSLRGKMWVDIEKQGKPSKWITLRVLRALKAAGLASFPAAA